ncbi:hypothetical protein L7F22_035983 [Adiantum nelumboides]|nr:hypothetical protein [Adiantum nelumboides]
MSLLLLSFLFIKSPFLVSEAAADGASTSTLLLNAGLHLSVRDSFDINGSLLPGASPFSAAFRAYKGGAYFLPILNSPSFNSFDASRRVGFSFGFLFSPSVENSLTHSIYNMYVAVCGGLAGNSSNLLEGDIDTVRLMGVDDVPQSISLKVLIASDGYVVPVWYANMTSLSSCSATLVVKEVAGQKNSPSKVKQLQLRDHNNVIFWQVSNVGLMEMQDSGVLAIYDTVNRKHTEWQSSKDTLFLDQTLSVGEQLTSIDSTFSARMEKGGLVLHINTLRFSHERQAPYWAIPIQLLNGFSNPLNVSKQVLLSAPCSNVAFNPNISISIGNKSLTMNKSHETLSPSSSAYAMYSMLHTINPTKAATASSPCLHAEKMSMSLALITFTCLTQPVSSFSVDGTVSEIKTCKRLCSFNCNCNGFFYKTRTSSCFFFNDGMTLLNLTDATWEGHYIRVQILADNYNTFLKIAKSTHISSNDKRSSSKSTKYIIVAITSAVLLAAFLGIGMAACVLHKMARKRRRLSVKAKQTAKEQDEMKDILPLLPTRFSYEELRRATNGFTNHLHEECTEPILHFFFFFFFFISARKEVGRIYTYIMYLQLYIDAHYTLEGQPWEPPPQ